MPAAICIIISLTVVSFAPAPPLSDNQRADLAAARDDGDYREQPFFALVASVRSWPSPASPDDEPIRLSPDFRSLLQNPAGFRGDLCRIAGEIVQQTALAPPYDDMSEWFVRDARDGVPVIVYVVRSDSDREFKDRAHVQIDARFYKRMRFVARDQKTREYPAFVGRFPQPTVPATWPVSSPIAPGSGFGGRGLDFLAILAGPVALLVIVLVGLRAWVSRKNRQTVEGLREGRAAWLDHDEAAMVDEAAGLPDDPAAALAELRRRALTAANAPENARTQGQTPA